LFDPSKPGGVILEIPTGQHYFKLERDGKVVLNFFHSSPGTGTRIASVDLKTIPIAETVFIGFSWSPQEINLHVRPKIPGSKLVSAKGELSPIQYRVGTDGSIIRIGGHNVKVMGTTFYKGGKAIITPTSLDSWNETIQVVDILKTGKSAEGHIYEVTIANLVLVVLVTGFEAYTKKRFVEMEDEGIPPNFDGLINSIYSTKDRDRGVKDTLYEEAKIAGISILKQIVAKRVINFQNFDDAKRAFNYAYGIKFREIGVSSQDLAKLQTNFRYRHRIIHVSTIPGISIKRMCHPKNLFS
jgi:hypothetical protein